jgi:hypothetical protein
VFRAFRTVDPLCEADGPNPGASWRATAQAGRVRGCLLDVSTDLGMLYDPYAPSSVSGWSDWNAYLKTRTRPFEVEVPAFAELPERPEALVERLSALALEASGDGVKRRKPVDRHARPYDDLPLLVHGRTFFDLRIELATTLFAHPDYRRWALERLRVDAERDLDDLRDRYRRRAPGAGPEAIEAALVASEDGRAIRARAERPAPADLVRILASWLGDLPAHELFVLWETSRIDDLLAGREGGATSADFVARWRALRDVLFVPSYARELTLLMPVHDRRQDRVGLYRVVLPRVAWMLPRLGDHEKHPGWSDLPLDLLPERPMACEALERILDRRPMLAAHLDRGGYRALTLAYESRMPPRKRTPLQAFRQSRVALVLAAGGRTVVLELDLDEASAGGTVELAGLRGRVEGDPVLAALVADLEAAADVDRLAGAAPSRSGR